MAAHHNPCHHHHHAAAAAAAAHSFCYGACFCSGYTSCHRCHLPPPLGSDLHHHPFPPHLGPDLLHHPSQSPHVDSALRRIPELGQHYDHLQHPFLEERGTYPTLSALLRRIAVLESAIHSRSSTTHHTPRALSLRDAAARTIQTHFRTFILRRSRTLGQLKDLASIKSTLAVLKSAVSENPHFDFNALYHKASELQRRLAAIQGRDPLIRNGKVAVNFDLKKFLNFLDGVSVDDILHSSLVDSRMKSGLASRERRPGTVKHDDVKRVSAQKLRTPGKRMDKSAVELFEDQFTEAEDIPLEYVIQQQQGISAPRSCFRGATKPATARRVSFADNGKVYKVVRIHQREDPVSEGSADANDLCSRIEEIIVSPNDENGGGGDDEEEVDSELGSSDNGSDAEENSRSMSKNQRHPVGSWNYHA